MPRKDFSARIQHLDPVKDHQEIVYLLTCHIFPWDIERALEFALFRTFAIPSISRLLAHTGEFNHRPRKRYDDTELIMYEILEEGYDSERAKRAFRRMNKMHGHYVIPNEDFLYVSSTFVFEPIRWINRFGWRPLTETEQLAIFYFYREVGIRMGIQNIPSDFSAFERFNREYEERHFTYTDSNQQVGGATVNLLLSFYMPKIFYPIGKWVAYSLMDIPLLNAMGFPHPPEWLRRFSTGLLKSRASVLRYLPEKEKPVLGTQRRRPTYPEGYAIEELGTFPIQRKNQETAK